MLDRRAGRIAFQPEVLERMQPGRRLPQHQGDQRQEGDQRFAGQDQVSASSEFAA
jgi:hypothetical protein